MKNIKHYYFVLTGIILILYSCSKRGIIDREFTPPKVYMTQGVVASKGNGFYLLPANVYNQPVYYTVENGKVNIPVGVVRSGVDLSGTVNVNYALDADTLSKLRANGIVSSEILDMPSGSYTLPLATTINNNETNAHSILAVDLNVLLNSLLNAPGKKYILPVKISTPNLQMAYASTLFIIDPATILTPKADFFNYTYADGTKTGFIFNKSINGASYTWDFGDGSAVVTDAAPAPHKYSAAGTYTITLKVKGVSDQLPISTSKQSITIQ